LNVYELLIDIIVDLLIFQDNPGQDGDDEWDDKVSPSGNIKTKMSHTLPESHY